MTNRKVWSSKQILLSICNHYSTDISYEVCKACMHQTWLDSWHCLNSPLSPCQSCDSCFVEICTPCCNHFKYFTSCHHTPKERSSIKGRTIVPGLAEDDHRRATIFVSFQAVSDNPHNRADVKEWVQPVSRLDIPMPKFPQIHHKKEYILEKEPKNMTSIWQWHYVLHFSKLWFQFGDNGCRHSTCSTTRESRCRKKLYQQKAGLYQETIEVFGRASQWSPRLLLQQQVLGPENHTAEKTSTMNTNLTITINFLVTMLSLFL